MELILKIAYYCGTGVMSLVFAFFFLANVLDPSTKSTPRLIFLCTGSLTIGLLYWSYVLANAGGNWLLGLGLAALALFLFAALTVLGLFLFTNVHWQ